MGAVAFRKVGYLVKIPLFSQSLGRTQVSAGVVSASFSNCDFSDCSRGFLFGHLYMILI